MVERTASSGDWPRPLVWAALVAAVAITFANALQNGFVFDDHLLLVSNRVVRTPIWDVVTGHLYRPLRTISYRIDFAIGGMHPWIFHLSNVVYHAITVLLVCTALRLATLPLAAAAAGALIFAVHPVQTDSVTYIAGRRDVLCGLFFVAGFAAYLSYRARRSMVALATAIVCYGAAILTKEMAVTLPVVCLAADRWLVRREHGVTASPSSARSAAAGRTRILWIVALLAIGAVVFALTYGPLFARIAGRMQWHGGSPGANFATVARIWAHYLGLVVWPATLVADYSFRTFPVSTSLLDGRAIASAVLLAALAVAAVRSWRRGGTFGFAAAWWAITLLPVSHIVPYRELMAEHYLYIPMVGVAFAVAGWVEWALAAAPARRRAVAAVVVIVAAALSARTIVRNRDWRNQETLWAATVAAAPDCARARFNLGQAYYEAVRFGDAEREWLAADAIKPGDLATARALAALYYRMGKYEVARARIEDALRTAPDDPDAQVLAGWIAVDNGEPARALPYFESATRRLPAAKAAGARLGIERAQRALDPTQQTAQRLNQRGAKP